IGRPDKAAAIIVDNDLYRPTSRRLPDGSFHLCVDRPDGLAFSLEVSEDLSTWVSLCTNVVTDGALRFVDPEALQHSRRLYRIVPGSYIERSGSLGDSFSSLPNASQRFVRLLVDPDPQSYLVTMTFLGEDMQTVFSAMPCPPGGPVSFSFWGSAYTDPMTFHVDPSPPPDEQQWSYAVSNSFNTLRIDGQVVALRRSCAEEQQFIHSNVVAVLVTP